MTNSLDNAKTIARNDKSGGYTLAVGFTLGQYRILRQLGRGGMGEVYKVEHKVLQRRYALKLLPQDFAARAGSLERFEREAQVMANLEHPNIIHVDEFGETAGRYWLRMELAKGTESDKDIVSLQDLADERGGKIPQEELIGILKQILEGLAYAHGHGTVHRDLKPSNILFSGGLVKISDFGLVRLVGEEWVHSQAQVSVQWLSIGEARTIQKDADEGTSTRSMLGTYEYMSPEQKRGEEATAQSDLYAVGLMAYKLVTGQNLGVKLPSRIVPGVAVGWDDFVEKALEEKAQDRWPNAKAMQGGLDEIARKIQQRESARQEETQRETESRRVRAEADLRAQEEAEAQLQAEEQRLSGAARARQIIETTPAGEENIQLRRELKGGSWKWAVVLLLTLFGIVLVVAAIYATRSKEKSAVTVVVGEGQPGAPDINTGDVIDATVPGAIIVPQMGYRYKVFVDDESDDRSSGIAKIGGFVTFIPGARPGQTAIVDVTRVRETVADAILVNVLSQVDLPPKAPRTAFVPPLGDSAANVISGAEMDVVISEASSKNPTTEGVAKVNGLSVFVNGAITIGERVNVRITERRERMAFAEPTGKPAGTDPLPVSTVASVRGSYQPLSGDPDANIVVGAEMDVIITEASSKNPTTEGVTWINGLVVFVNGVTTIGQRVNVRITARREKIAFAEPTGKPVGTDQLPVQAAPSAARAPRPSFVPLPGDSAAFIVPGAVIAATITEASAKNPTTEGVTRVNGLVVFVRGATTIGQAVNVRITDRRERIAIGEVTPDAVTVAPSTVVPAALTAAVNPHEIEVGVDQALVDDLDLTDIPNQGKVVQVEGELRNAPFLAASPSRYRLCAMDSDGLLQMVCHIHGKENELRLCVGKTVSIQGREYQVKSSDMPVVVVGKISPKL